MADISRFLPAHPVGWPLLAAPDETGALSWPGLETSVRQAIRCILMTRKGEWLLARQSGAGLADYVHKPNTPAMRQLIRENVMREIMALESRIELDGIDVGEAGENGDEIAISIAYRIKRTGSADVVAVSMKARG